MSVTQDSFDAFDAVTRGLKNFSAHARVSPRGGLRIVFEGYLDGDAANAVSGPLVALVAAWDGAPRIIVDLAELQYIASLGIGMLTMAAVAAKKRAIDMSLESPRPAVLHVLELLGIPEYIPVVTGTKGEGG